MSYLDEFYQRVEKTGVVPVVVLDEVDDALPLADALAEGGLPAAEVTFRTAAAADAIRAISEARPEVLVGAGTVLNVAQAEAAVEAGARFVVSPGFSPEVVDWCLEHEVPQIPAGVTPAEITWLINRGLDVTKYFPASLYGGLGGVKTLASVFVGHRFMPTGGIRQDDLEEYLSCPAVLACGGTWITKAELVRAGRFDEVARLAAAAAAVVARACARRTVSPLRGRLDSQVTPRF